MPTISGLPDWTKIAHEYESRSGGITTRLTEHIIPLLPPITDSSRIHDNAAGPGPLIKLLLPAHPTAHVDATDASAGMIDVLLGTAKENGWPNVTGQVMDSTALEFADESFTHSVSSLVVFMLDDPEKGVREIYRTLKLGGTAVVTTWKVPRPQEIVSATRQAINPKLPPYNPVAVEWKKEQKLREVLVAGGFKSENIDITCHEVAGEFGTIELLVEALSGGFWAASRNDLSDEENAQWGTALVKCLTERERENRSMEGATWIAVARK